jgi:hypothetical protein
VSSEIESEKEVVIKNELEKGNEEEEEIGKDNEEDEKEILNRVCINEVNLSKGENVVVVFSSEYAYASNIRKSENETKSETLSNTHLTTYEKYLNYKTYIKPAFIEGPNSEIVNSLNVSVAAGIILNQIIGQVKERKFENRH